MFGLNKEIWSAIDAIGGWLAAFGTILAVWVAVNQNRGKAKLVASEIKRISSENPDTQGGIKIILRNPTNVDLCVIDYGIVIRKPWISTPRWLKKTLDMVGNWWKRGSEWRKKYIWDYFDRWEVGSFVLRRWIVQLYKKWRYVSLLWKPIAMIKPLSRFKIGVEGLDPKGKKGKKVECPFTVEAMSCKQYYINFLHIVNTVDEIKERTLIQFYFFNIDNRSFRTPPFWMDPDEWRSYEILDIEEQSNKIPLK
ncbi:hypothetical protein [Paludifilum halophilum]|uniref:Uncharacterized protein n=1 Tax=Paludifilum halophilum TaxID=1642702 RepID=A0A235B1S4_9BACL|nr:hypothetical protein [Paludifilum halophilum]OYD06258.1 hypothetical protein CHM34_16975 [Paludifilum halophilum]